MVLQQEGSVLKPVASPKGQTFKFWGLHLLLESIFIFPPAPGVSIPKRYLEDEGE